jgi:signal transduction histidine kinase
LHDGSRPSSPAERRLRSRTKGGFGRPSSFDNPLVESRFRALVEAGIAVSSELSLDAVLLRILDAAAELTEAQYAALGVIDRSGTGLERFLVTGIDLETRRLIGDDPHGRGILGTLIREARPLRLRDLTAHADSVGFPPHHPQMTTFLGVPILLRGIAYGNLYLTEKREGEFTQEDEDVITLLAAQAAVAIENARLYESATRWSSQLESLIEVGNAVAGEIELPRVLQLVADRLRELILAEDVFIAFPSMGRLVIQAAAGAAAASIVGSELHPASKSVRVLGRGRSERVDSLLDDPEVDQEFTRRLAASTALYVPLLVGGEAIGIVVAHDKHGRDPRFTDEDLRLAETFASRAAVAAELSTRVARDTVARVVDAQELERRRLARELHDETGQALTSVLLELRALEEAKDPAAVSEATTRLRHLIVETLHDVRNLAVELRPKALDDFGLVPALERLTETFAEQTAIPVELEALLGDERLPPAIETALYRIVQEALTNVIKHSRASRVSVLLTRKQDTVAAVIEDDGIGFVPAQARDGGLGLIGMRERVGLLDGRLTIESSPESGTSLVAEVPIR